MREGVGVNDVAERFAPLSLRNARRLRRAPRQTHHHLDLLDVGEDELARAQVADERGLVAHRVGVLGAHHGGRLAGEGSGRVAPSPLGQPRGSVTQPKRRRPVAVVARLWDLRVPRDPVVALPARRRN